MSLARPRVLVVIAQLDIGGAERQVVALAKGLAADGYPVHVAAFYENGELEPQLVEAGIPVIHLERRTFHGLETILDLRRRIRALEPDVVHSFLWPANWRARAAAISSRVPVIISSTRSVETWLRWYHVAVDRLLALGTHAIVVNASAIRDFLMAREGIRADLLHVIPNGLDLTALDHAPSRETARDRLGIPAGAPVVLIVGNLQPEKNHEDFLALAAASHAGRPDAVFVVVGDGPRRDALRERERELGLSGRIRWAGRRSDVPVFLAASDLFVNTSRREGCCNAILEAMAVSRPVVAYAVGGNPELVDDGRTGRLIDFGDVDGLVRAVESYLADPALAADHGRAGRERILSGFSREAMVSTTETLYGRLLARRGSERS